MIKGEILPLIERATAKDCQLELSDEQTERIRNISGIALALVAGAGIIAMSAMAPNMFVALDKIFRKKGRKLKNSEKQEKIAHAFYYLKRSGQIEMRRTAGDFKISLTKLGRKRVSDLDFETLAIKKPKYWNGHWWQVAGDIPTKKHKKAADALRGKLRTMGFYLLQRTLWFYPYDPREELQRVLEVYEIERFVTVMEILRVDKEDEKRLVKFFQARNLI